MKFSQSTFLSLALLASASCSSDQTTQEKAQEKALAIAQSTMMVDTHIDVPYRLQNHYEDVSQSTEGGDFDYPRAKKGGLDVLFMSIYTPAKLEAEGTSYQVANELINGVEKLATDHPDKFSIVTTVAEAKNAFDKGQVGFAMGMENGSPIDHKLENVKYFYDRGVRYITLAHSLSNHLSDSSYDQNRQWNGLSDFGKEVVQEMNRLGIMVDISHVSDDAFYQVMELTTAPVIASHSSARHFTPTFERNMSDDMIKKLAENDGVIMISFGSVFISQQAVDYSAARRAAVEAYVKENQVEFEEVKAFEEQYKLDNPYPFATLEQVLDHFDHVVGLVGVDHVGLGSDYDGVGDSLPIDLKSVADYPNLVAGFLERGYSEEDIQKILSGNILRVWKAVEEVASNQQ